ncbi:MFS transporter [Serratia ureilytica]
MPYTPAAAQNLAGDLRHRPIHLYRRHGRNAARRAADPDSQHLERIDRPSRAADFLPALFAALFAPLVVLGARRTDRRSLLIVFLLLLIAANLLAAAATSMALLFAARILLGFCIGGIWAIAGGLAERLVPPASVGLALSVIFGGVAAASVLGVPLGCSSAKRWAGAWRFWPSPSWRR